MSDQPDNNTNPILSLNEIVSTLTELFPVLQRALADANTNSNANSNDIVQLQAQAHELEQSIQNKLSAGNTDINSQDISSSIEDIAALRQQIGNALGSEQSDYMSDVDALIQTATSQKNAIVSAPQIRNEQDGASREEQARREWSQAMSARDSADRMQQAQNEWGASQQAQDNAARMEQSKREWQGSMQSRDADARMQQAQNEWGRVQASQARNAQLSDGDLRMQQARNEASRRENAPAMNNIIENLTKRYENDPKYGAMPEELKNRLQQATPSTAMQVTKDYWAEQGYSRLSESTQNAILSANESTLQGQRYAGQAQAEYNQKQENQQILMRSEASRQAASYAAKAEAEYQASKTPGQLAYDDAKEEAKAAFANSNIPKNLGGEDKAAVQTYQKNTTNAFAGHVQKVVDGGGNAAEAKEQINKVAAIYNSGDPKKIQDWENFVKAQTTISEKPTGVSGSADNMERQINSALSGQSSFVQQKVREAINSGNTSDVNSLVTWFKAEEAKANSITSNPGATGSVDNMERQIESALAGQSTFVKDQVRSAINSGNTSGVENLVTWFKQVEANNNAAAAATAQREQEINNALSGQSAYVQNNVRQQIASGNSSSVHDLITWFKASDPAAKVTPVSNIQSTRNTSTGMYTAPTRRSGGGGGGLKYM